MAHQPVLTTDNLDEGRIKYNANDVELYSLVDDAQSDADAALSALTDKADLVSGLVPTSQLPSYVDDVIEVANFAALPGAGTGGIIYITLDDNKQFRWTGSVYVDITGTSLALGETSGTAYRGDRGKIAYDYSQAHLNVDDTSDANKPVSTAQAAADLLKLDKINTSGLLTDAATIDLTANKHHLASSAATRTFTISYTGDDGVIELTLSATSATYTMPATSLCVSEGIATGNNIFGLAGVSGDKYIISWKKIGSAYYVACKNFGQ